MANVSGFADMEANFKQVVALGTKTGTSLPQLEKWKATFLNGTAADQCDLMHAKPYTLAASTPQTLNLYDGSLLDLIGAACAFRRVCYLAYRLRSTTNTHEVLLGGAGTDEWNGWLRATGSKVAAAASTAINQAFTEVVAPNTAGYAVTNSSKFLKLDPGANAVGLFDIIIVGRSVA